MTGSTYGKLLTWWESPDGGVRVECRRHRGAFQVRTLRAGHESGQWRAATETGARELFERIVEQLATTKGKPA